LATTNGWDHIKQGSFPGQWRDAEQRKVDAYIDELIKQMEEQ